MVDNNEKYTKDARNVMALELLPEFRKELGNFANGVTDENLVKFLRWKPDIKRASDRYRKYIEWRKTNPGIFDEQLRLSKDQEIKRIMESSVMIAPDELKTKTGGSLLVGRFRNNDMTDGRTPKDVARMILYTIDRVIERKETQLDGITLLHDLTDLDKKKNMNMEISRTTSNAIMGHFPLRVNAVYILKAPWFFPAIYAVMSRLFISSKIRKKIHFIDKISELYDNIDKDDMLVEHGGKLDFNVSVWAAHHMQREKDGTLCTLTDIGVPSS